VRTWTWATSIITILVVLAHKHRIVINAEESITNIASILLGQHWQKKNTGNIVLPTVYHNRIAIINVMYF